MEKYLKIFFDAEFTGLSKNTDILSLACITDNNDIFYWERSSIGTEMCVNKMIKNMNPMLPIEEKENNINFIRNNVIGNFILNSLDNVEKDKNTVSYINSQSKTFNMYKKSNLDVEVSMKFIYWLLDIKDKYKADKIVFCSDVGHYDFVLLIDLITNGGSALNLPDWVLPYSLDYIHNLSINNDYSNAFNISREEIFCRHKGLTKEQIPEYVKNSLYNDEFLPTVYPITESTERKHNALWDAFILKEIWDWTPNSDFEF